VHEPELDPRRWLKPGGADANLSNKSQVKVEPAEKRVRPLGMPLISLPHSVPLKRKPPNL
jgi:hypothetical protein